MKPETRFKLRVHKDLKTLRNKWIHKTQEVSKIGIPDFLLCINGNFVAIELKKDDTEKPSKLQEYNLSQIALASGTSFVACPENWDVIFHELRVLDGMFDCESAIDPQELPHDECEYG